MSESLRAPEQPGHPPWPRLRDRQIFSRVCGLQQTEKEIQWHDWESAKQTASESHKGKALAIAWSVPRIWRVLAPEYDLTHRQFAGLLLYAILASKVH